YEMYEKAPSNIEIAFPMKEGVVSRFNDMQYILNNLLKSGRRFIRGSEYVIAVPTDVTEVEKKAFYDLLIHSSAKARSVFVIDRGVADAVGLGLDVKNSRGIFIANLGAETMELSVISYGGIVLNKLVKKGALHLDISIQNLVRQKYDFLIGKLTAENLRRSLGFFSNSDITKMNVTGRNVLVGVPQQKEITVDIVRAATKESLDECVTSIRSMLERTPPDILRTIREDGIYLVGGLANLNGIDIYFSEMLQIPVTVGGTPELNSVKGIARIINSKDLKDLTYSMLDGNYRWMR
ncbi:MAG: rod shape-determining protein, partial [Eubacteriales bacterium]